jgi:actin beta/gamma 1
MELSTVVIDNGAYMMRAGLGGDSEPFSISSVVSHAGHTPIIEHRRMQNFDDLSRFWDYLLRQQLRLNPEEHPVLMTEPLENPRENRERALQIMMETHQVPAYYSTYPEILSLYASGITTGMVIDSGDTLTHILPIFECFAMTHVQSKLEVGGRQLNVYLRKLLNEANPGLVEHPLVDKDLTDIKEKWCYVAGDFDIEFQKVEHLNEAEKQVVTEESGTIQLSAQRFRCPEPFFDPRILGVTSPGLSSLILDSIIKTEDLSAQMLGSIVLAGGSSMFNGLQERIERNLIESDRLPGGATVKIIAPGNRNNSAWVGGSVLASLATFSQMWVTKQEYEETGPAIVHLKCF